MTDRTPKLCLFMQKRIEEQIADNHSETPTGKKYVLAGFTEPELRTIQAFIRSFEPVESNPEDFIK